LNGISPLKHGFVDLAAILFVIGGVVSLAMTVLALPINMSNPLSMPTGLSTASIVVLAVMLISSLGAIHCFSLAGKRMLSEAGVRGIVFGALLLIFSFGLGASNLSVPNTGTTLPAALLTQISAILIMIAGVICFALRLNAVSASPIARQHAIAQPVYQP
jgi:hypothetical protein